MKNFKNTLTNKISNSNIKPHYKAISLVSLSTLALTLISDASTVNAMMGKTGTVKFYGSNGSRVISGTHNKLPLTTSPNSISKVIGDIAGRFTNTGKIGNTSTTNSSVKTNKYNNTQLKLGSSGYSQIKKPTTTTTINQNASSLPNTNSTSTKKHTNTPTINQNASSLPNTNSTSTKKPTTTTTINQNASSLPNTNSTSTKKPTTTTTQLGSNVYQDNSDPNFRPTQSNKPVVSVGTQTDPDIDGVKTNITSKKPTITTGQFSDDYSINTYTLQIKEDGDGQTNNASATISQPNNNNNTNKKLTKKEKITIGVLGGVAGLGTIIGLSVGLTSNNNGNTKNEGTPPKLVPVPKAPKYSMSIVSSPEGNLFTDN